MFEFSRGNYAQKTNEILEATRGLSSTDLEGTHLIECLRSQLKDVTEEMERLRAENERLRGGVQSIKAAIDGLSDPMEQTRNEIVDQLRARLVKELYSGEG